MTKKIIFMAVVFSLVGGGSFAVASHQASADWYGSGYGGGYYNNCGCDNVPPPPPVIYTPPAIYTPPPTYTPAPAPTPVVPPPVIYTPPAIYTPPPTYTPAPAPVPIIVSPVVYTPPAIYTPPPIQQPIIQTAIQTAPALQVTCQANPVHATVGSTITWTAYISGGPGYYGGYGAYNNAYYNNYNTNYYNGLSIAWTGTDGLAANSSAVVSKTYITPGEKVATVTVQAYGQSVTTSCASFISASAPVYVPPPISGTTHRVYLNQVPYTGAGSATKIILFGVLVLGWSVLVAWMLMKRRAARLGGATAVAVAPTENPMPVFTTRAFLTNHVNQLRQAL